MMTDDEPRIYARHARAAGLCGPGITRVVERYGINWLDFAENGIAVAKALALTSNPLVAKAAKLATEEWEAAHGKG